MKFEIEKQYRPILNRVQYYAVVDGVEESGGFDTPEEAEAYCDRLASVPKPERYEYTPKQSWFAKEAAVDAANVSSDMAMDVKLNMAGI